MTKPFFSIIILTKDRPHFLKRTLDFLSDQNCEYKVFVADGSENEFKGINSQKVSYKNYGGKISYTDRIIDTIKKINTPYIMVLGDDDFINLSRIPEICSFLDNHPDYSVVDGQEIRVRCSDSGIVENIFHHQPSLTDDDTFERFRKHCSLYWPTFYGVHRKEVFLKSFELMSKLHNLGYLYQELGASIATILQGKYKSFPDLYLIRQNFHQASTQTTWWTDILKQKDFKENNKIFIEEIAEFCRENNIEINKKMIEDALNLYYKPFQKQNFRSKIRYYMQKIFPYCIINLVKKMNNILCKKNDKNILRTEQIETLFYQNVSANLKKLPFGNKK